jgi:hypothetical protein
MASNKNQHFVPRTYFKPFTAAKEGKTINLFNIDRTRCVRAAPVKHQCSKDYFYGDDMVLEKGLLHEQESQYARTVAAIHEHGYELTDEHQRHLLEFWLIQHLRTEAASRRITQMSARAGDIPGVPKDQFKMEILEAVKMGVLQFHRIQFHLDDIKVCLIRNRTKTPFLISDDPAIYTNRWYNEDGRAKPFSPGLCSAGAIFLLPLSPEVLCLGYDDNAYSVPHQNRWVVARNDGDIRALNEHQFLNCHANIYFADWEHEQTVASAYSAISLRRPAARYEVGFAERFMNGNGKEIYRSVNGPEDLDVGKAFVHYRTIVPKPSTWPRFLLRRPDGTAYTSGASTGFVRRARVYDFAISNFGPQSFKRVRL